MADVLVVRLGKGTIVSGYNKLRFTKRESQLMQSGKIHFVVGSPHFLR
jgi:hypothetical protein